MKTIAIISDIHSNLEALNAVLEDVKRHAVDAIYCLGNVVSYGPNPVECFDAICQCCEFTLMGRSEETMLFNCFGFNVVAREQFDWTRKQLKPKWYSSFYTHQRWKILENVPESYSEDHYLFVHATPRCPTADFIGRGDTEDFFGEIPSKIKEVFSLFEQICFVGHTHQPSIITENSQWYKPEDFNSVWEVKKGERLFCNVGSVGQPRDRNPKASYVIFNGQQIQYHRVEYDYKITMEKIYKIPQLHNRLADRLAIGV